MHKACAHVSTNWLGSKLPKREFPKLSLSFCFVRMSVHYAVLAAFYTPRLIIWNH